ncbi:MAG: hypothetical protein WKF58_09965 [Ilumatobacteraceae bacterium]
MINSRPTSTTSSRHLVTIDTDGATVMTPAGERLLAGAVEVQRVAQAQIHDSVSSDDLLTTMKVLRRMIHNTDGKFWHH